MDRHTWGVLAAVAVGAVVLVSSITKLAAPDQWRGQATALGVPRRLVPFVPFAEAVLAAWLVVQWQRHLAAWLAAIVLGAFTALLALRLLQGRRPPCACFGSWSAKPIGPGHLLRNFAFIALAVAAGVL